MPRGQKGGSVGQSRPSASRRLRWASRALCASHESRPSHTSSAPPASCAPSSAGESGAGSGGVTRECAGGAAVDGSGAGSGRVTGGSSAEAAAHPNAAGGDSVRPGKRCLSMARRTVSTRSACVIVAARAAAPACAAAASAAACSRSMRSLSALSMRLSARARRARSSVATGSSRAPSSAMVRSASVRRVSIAMRALSPSARGSRGRVPIPRQSDRSRAAGRSGRPCARPSGPRRVAHARSVVRARSKANDRRRAHGPAPRSRPGWRRPRSLRQRRPGLRPATARPMSPAHRAHGVPLVVALPHGAMLLRMARHVHRTMVRGGRASLKGLGRDTESRASLRHAFPGSVWSGLGFTLRCQQI